MAAPVLKPEPLSHAEYLAIEAASEVRHELYEGVMYAMAGGTRTHGALGTRVGLLLGSQLETCGGGCTTYGSDVRVCPDTGESMYPDLTIACPPIEESPHDPHAIANPVVLVEVLSPSTAGWDVGGKFELFRRFASLRHVLFVSSDAWHVHHRERISDETWRYTDHGPGTTVELTALGVRLEVDALFAPLVAQGGPPRDAVPVFPRPRLG